MKERIENILNSAFASGYNTTDLTEELKHEIETVYYEIHGRILVRTWSGCTNCFINGLSEIKAYYLTNKTEIMNNKPRQFKLREDQMIQHIELSHPITNANCTDEMAFELLRINPKAITLFAEYPEDWEDQMKGTSKSIDDEMHDENETIEQRREALKTKSVAALKEYAESMDLPKEAWENLKKKELIDYLLETLK